MVRLAGQGSGPPKGDLPNDVVGIKGNTREFRTGYLASNILYTNEFLLDAGSPDFYTLFDADMENVSDLAISPKL